MEIEEAYYVYLNEPEWQKPNKWMRSYDRYFNFYKMLMYSPIQVRFIQMKRTSNKLWKDVSYRLGQAYKKGEAKESLDVEVYHHKFTKELNDKYIEAKKPFKYATFVLQN